jgi:hypothetical protein
MGKELQFEMSDKSDHTQKHDISNSVRILCHMHDSIALAHGIGGAIMQYPIKNRILKCFYVSNLLWLVLCH